MLVLFLVYYTLSFIQIYGTGKLAYMQRLHAHMLDNIGIAYIAIFRFHKGFSCINVST